MFDRLPDPNAGAHQLTFRKEEILFIDNTMYNGTPGHWSAWLVDVDGQRGEWGVVPSKYKVRTNFCLLLLSNQLIVYTSQ